MDVELKIDQLVLIRDDNQSRNQWKTARVKSLTYTPDGEVKSASLILPNGSEIWRSVHSLSVFELI